MKGELGAWGSNEYGQLGIGITGAGVEGVDNLETIDPNTPVEWMFGYQMYPVRTKGPSKVVAISLGGAHTAALTANGDLYTWGNNEWGQLGDGKEGKDCRNTLYKVMSGVMIPGAKPSSTPSTPQASEIKVLLDGKPLTFDVPPQIINGSTMVPMRKIFEALGASVTWDAGTQTATGIKGDTVIKLTIGNTSPTVNGKVVSINQPGVILGGRTLVPLRFVGEALGVKVDWNGTTRTVIITS